MKKLLLITFLFVSSQIMAQLITTEPSFPIANKSVTITFDASQGDKGLMDYTGDVYAHTGVITNKSTGSTDWQYVKTEWGENTTETKLTRIEANKYTLTISPSITEYYEVPSDENILQIAFVFRSHDNSKQAKTAEGGDIFVELFEETLSVNIISPDNNLITKAGEQIEISAAANLADKLILYVDDEKIEETTTNNITHTITTVSEGKHWIWVEAKDATTSVYDSVSYFIKEDINIADLPNGVRNGINYIDDKTVTLVLNAPEKEYVYLIGDFNDWDISNVLETEMSQSIGGQVTATTWMMNKTTSGNHFWLTIEDVTPKAEYRYQYLIDGEIRVADPYTEKVIDPWNDKYITEETYPSLIPYPDGKTNEPVSVFQSAQEKYVWEVTDFVAPEITDMVVYEMLIRDFVETHSYKTIADTLNYLENLGVNVLELMPINEFEGNSSWGYNPSFYFAPDKYYGPKEELKRLIDECHKRGIAVVIDMVLNHSFGQSPLARMYMENGKPAANNPWYNVEHNFTNTAAHWGHDFNHESTLTQALVDSVNAFWMSEYMVDGFRFDFTKGFGNNVKDGSDEWGSKYDSDRVRLLKRMANEIWKRNSDAYVIFEHLAENIEERDLANYGILMWGNMNHNYTEGAMGWNESGKSDFSWISYKKRGWSNPHVIGYMESHDEERMMFKNLEWGNSEGEYNIKEPYTARRRVELAANFFIPIPGPKMIWQFGELGYDYSIDHNERVGEKPIRWDYFDKGSRKRIYEVMAYLNKLKVEEPAFKTTDFTLNVDNELKSIHLNHTDMNVVILGNFDVLEGSINPEFQNTGTWYEYYTGTEVSITDTQAEITLAPGEYRLYTTKKLGIPDINPSVRENQNLNTLFVYPNPANNVLYFNTDVEAKSIQICNIAGQIVYQTNFIESNSVNTSGFSKGLFFIQITDNKNQKQIGKFIIN